MNTHHRFILEPYKGPSTRHTCPQCRKPKEVARYLDTATGELLPDHVGKCNRADACGYHFTPRDHFRDTGTHPTEADGNAWEPKPEPPPRPPYVHQRAEVLAMRSHPERNTLAAYWRDRIGGNRWNTVARDYALGTWPSGSLAGAAVYWQVDQHGNVKAGKVMLYDPATGKRRKDVRSTSFVHFEQTGHNAAELNVGQCLFGEHLLKSWPMDAPVAVVESEKTAMIAAALMPSFLWVAVGSVGAFTLTKLQALTGRKVLAFPDLSRDGSAFAKWREKAVEIGHLFDAVHVSDLLERMATDADRRAGLDIGDYLLRSGDEITTTATPNTAAPVNVPAMILSEAETVMQRWAERNPAINTLVDVLGLDLSRAKITKLDPLK
ncbi:MAG TPA: DUF6371 domain-containing protein [Flavobacteriales bacterium]|nr:DUF6371 domain-containing protein [Flavobacteriales bacterium]